MTRILVTGASGLLGLNLALHLHEREDILGIVHTSSLVGVPFPVLAVDLTEPGQARKLLEMSRPDVLIHCAAQANLDVCEQNPELAEKVNAALPGELASLTKRMGIRLVHISTDAVFDGQRGNYREEDQPNPINTYARTKLMGEERVRSANPDALVARVNFYGFSLNGRRSLAEFFLNNLLQRRPVNGFTDVIFCPLWVNHLVDLLMEALQKDLTGLYHVLGREALSKYDFGIRLAKRFELPAELIRPVRYADGAVRLAAPRSPDLSASSEKLAAALGHPLPGVDEGLEGFYAQYRQGFGQYVQSFQLDLRSGAKPDDTATF